MSFKRDPTTGEIVCFKGETGKAKDRRLQEGWFEKYAPENKPGLDIGCSDDPLNHTFRRWDLVFYDGDATYLEGVPNESYFTVYASHLVEHLSDPRKAIKRWYEVLRPGGHLIVIAPHRDLYEQKKMLPSYNPEHVRFWLPDEEDLPCTKSLKKEVLAAIPDADIVSLRVLDDGYEPGTAERMHPLGEYGIELIVRKGLSHEKSDFAPRSVVLCGRNPCRDI